ncbi:unnamed protein product [Moneuplotes crassus]|uniref:Complex 1 LYR protein n=1 Tax=Euplotes crassus TaxID=5936 RepID=A0AAD2D741_EUPCR|nr:unnamed protein product [Moneuplotes crassus]
MSSKIIGEIAVPNPKTMMMYRRMLKAMMRAFKGDYEMFHMSRIEFRKNILEYKDIQTKKELNKVLFGFEEGRRMLLKNIMQGDLQNDGSYRWNVRREHAMGTSVKEWNDDPDKILEELKKIKDAPEPGKDKDIV